MLFLGKNLLIMYPPFENSTTRPAISGRGFGRGLNSLSFLKSELCCCIYGRKRRWILIEFHLMRRLTFVFLFVKWIVDQNFVLSDVRCLKKLLRVKSPFKSFERLENLTRCSEFPKLSSQAIHSKGPFLYYVRTWGWVVQKMAIFPYFM